MKKSFKRNQNFSQGKFTPQSPQKYKGSLPIIYRSSLELKVFRWLDNNPKVVSWGSESVVIPYISPFDNRMHRYFTDLVIHLIDSKNILQKLLVEIKPHKYTLKPVDSPRKSRKTVIYEQSQYIINNAKWDAAKNWCKKNGYQFIIITEKHINS
jgi:hypothetical protein